MKVVKTCFLDNLFLNANEKRICELEDRNKVLTIFGWNRCDLRRDDHCCDKMFNYLKRDEAWMQYISYDKTYALPYRKLLSKKQLQKIWKYIKEMQIVKFCPFCGACVIDEKISELRLKKMEEYYEKYKKNDEFWVFFWDRHRYTSGGKKFFSDEWMR